MAGDGGLDVFLVMWTVYDEPRDLPGVKNCARQWLVVRGQDEPVATNQVMVGPLDLIRRFLEQRGLACVPRSEGDDPAIVESWM